DEPFVDDVDGRAVRPRPGVDASERQLDGVDDLANGLRGPGAQVGCALTTLKQEQARDMILHAAVQPARTPLHAADTEARVLGPPGVEHRDEPDAFPTSTEDLRHLERHFAAERDAGQVVGTLRSDPLDFFQVVAGHVFDARLPRQTSVEMSSLHAPERLVGSEPPCEIAEVVAMASAAVDAEQRRPGSGALQRPERRARL